MPNTLEFAVATILGNSNALDDGDGTTNVAQVFDITNSTSQYMRLTINTTALTYLGFYEIEFEVASARVPGPSILELLGLGLSGIGFSRRGK